jgi:hypothetical protein
MPAYVLRSIYATTCPDEIIGIINNIRYHSSTVLSTDLNIKEQFTTKKPIKKLTGFKLFR